jgi:hypothetical protein
LLLLQLLCGKATLLLAQYLDKSAIMEAEQITK